jgi:very-short-patch-repair endonuclease
MNQDPRLLEFAREMRKEPTPAERRMWRLLRNRRLAGFRFRRQHPVGRYIADFYCAVARLVIELDGDTHVGNEEADRVREEYLRDRGLRVIRFWNFRFAEDGDAVLDAVYAACVEGTRDNPLVQHKLNANGLFDPAAQAQSDE